MAICFSLALAAALPASEPATPVATTVRPDPRTGRLVRRAVAPPKPAWPASASPASSLPPQAAPPADYSRLIEETARTHDVDPLLVQSVIRVESNFDAFAVSPKGAEGLMQLIPETARRFGAFNSFDARENITAGVKYLKYLQDMFKDDRLALAAYNAGEGAVLKYRDVPPYKETADYVEKVGKTYNSARGRRPPAGAAAEAAPEPLGKLDVATDTEGRIVLRTR